MDCVRSLRDVAGTTAVEALRSGCSWYVNFLTTRVCCYSTETNEDEAENGVELAALLPETPQRNGTRDEDSKTSISPTSMSTAADENSSPRPSAVRRAVRRIARGADVHSLSPDGGSAEATERASPAPQTGAGTRRCRR